MKPKFLIIQKRSLLLVIVLLCTLIGYLLYGIFSLPNEIYVSIGKDVELSFNLPFKITAEPEAIAVSGMNDTPVTAEADSSGTLSINTEETGKTNLELSFLGISVKKIQVEVLPEMEVVPCGKTVGVEINTQGIMVLGTGSVDGSDGKTYHPAENLFKSGDMLLTANDKELNKFADLTNILKNYSGNDNVNFRVRRNNEIINLNITPVVDSKGEVKLGLWLRDGTQGIGTMTYYDPETKHFGALGHGIMDVDTKKLISVKDGSIMDSTITTVKKGKKGSPGELVGEIKKDSKLGEIKVNTSLGLYGIVNNNSVLPSSDEKVKIGLQNDVHTGPAVILSNVSGSDVKKYDIYIESVNKMSSDESKGMVLRITDQELLSKTNGIVQGMSGSPIIQDGKLIGAVTHVFVQNPAKGYGIFIENMIKQEKDI